MKRTYTSISTLFFLFSMINAQELIYDEASIIKESRKAWQND